MRASRAYITSLGTTSVLVASSLLLLAVVSTFVAFRAWPGDDLVNGLEGLLVDESQPSLELTGPAQVAADAAPAAAAVAASPPPGTPLVGATAAAAPGESAPTGTTLGTIDTQPPFTSPGPAGPQGGGRGSDGTTPQSPDGPAVPSLPPPQGPNELSTRLGDSTQSLTGGLGETLGRISPVLGGTVTDTGGALSELVRGLGPGLELRR